MFQFLPMAIGAGAGLLTSKDPLQGAVTGAALGGMTGGLGGLGGGAAGAGAAGTGLTAGTQAAGSSGLYSLAPGAAPQTGILAAGNAGQGIAATVGNGVQLTPSTAKSSGLAGIFNKDNLQTASTVAGLAGQMGIFDDPQAPTAPSAGIPARQADFSGLLRSQGQANNAAGAQRLLQQQMARKQGRL